MGSEQSVGAGDAEVNSAVAEAEVVGQTVPGGVGGSQTSEGVTRIRNAAGGGTGDVRGDVEGGVVVNDPCTVGVTGGYAVANDGSCTT